MNKKALEGVNVIDISLAESGPVAMQILSLLGANVYHVTRPSPPPIMGGHGSGKERYRGEVIRNLAKKNVTIDAKTPEGQELLWKLVEKADVFFENYAPGAWERNGFSYEEIKKRNPEIIYVSLKGFAKDSPWGDCITLDPVACSMGGSSYMSGYDGGSPALCGINVGDSGAGLHAALAVLMAIVHKKLTGKGQYIETPMADAVTCLCRSGFTKYYETGDFRRPGNTFRGTKPNAPHNIYPTLGGDLALDNIVINCSGDNNSPDFENLCKAMDREDLLSDSRYATPELRYENRGTLDAEIAKWTLKYNKNDVMDILMRKYNIAAGAIHNMEELLHDKFLQSTILNTIHDKELADFLTPGDPIMMSENHVEPISGGRAGSANDQVYHGELGLSLEYLEELRSKKII